MSVVIIATDAFKREAKRLAKKHLSLKSDLARLGQDLAANPRSVFTFEKTCTKYVLL
jgi:hypothetical protein